MAESAKVPPTRAERLHALIEKFAPAIAQHYNESTKQLDGQNVPAFAWPKRPAEDGGRPNARAPYSIDELPDGSRRVRIFSEDGDAISGVGPTVEAAIVSLEQKLSNTAAS